jgi:hypothetical protein
VVVDKPQRRLYSGDTDGVIWPWISSNGLAQEVATEFAQGISKSLHNQHNRHPVSSSSSSSTAEATAADAMAHIHNLSNPAASASSSYHPDGRPLTHPALKDRAITCLALQPKGGRSGGGKKKLG